MTTWEVRRGLEPPPERPSPSEPPVESTWVLLKSDDFDGELQLRFDTMPNGRLVLHQLTLESRSAITSAALEALPLQEVWKFITPGPRQGPSTEPVSLEGLRRRLYTEALGFTDHDFEILERTPEARDSTRVGREGPSFEDLELFALIYRIAEASRPTRAIAETMDRLKRQYQVEISRATANRWRQLAQQTDPPLLPGGRPPMRRPGVEDDDDAD